MLRLSCSYSRKAQAEEAYSSRSYHAGLEVELPAGLTGDQIDDQVHNTFEQLRRAVEAEISGQVPSNGDKGAHQSPDAGNSPAKRGRNGGNGRRISNAQAKFALDLARRNGVTLADLDQMIRDEWGVGGLYDMDASSASALIDTLKVKKAA